MASTNAAQGTAPASSVSADAAYTITPLPLFGAEVQGIDLRQDVPSVVVARIKDDVRRHRLLVFRDQDTVPAQRQAAISRWFGPLDSRPFSKHPASPCTDVFRVSNDPSQGCTNVGRSGWHIDGTFQHAPYTHSIYHMVHVPTQGDTLFLPFTEFIEAVPPDMRARWERLWMVSDRQAGPAHPLIYPHPETGAAVMCLHLGMTDAFIWDKGSPQQRVCDRGETVQLLREIDAQIRQHSAHLVYRHKWREGDFVISDNLALAHEASEESQLPRSAVGLRVLHRTTVQGRTPPSKARVGVGG